MIAYHGSVVSGLTELIPFANPESNLDFPCVYLTTLKPLSAVYLWNKPYKWMNFAFTSEKKLVYVESFPGALEAFYGGVSGAIYTCEGAFEQNPLAKVPTAVISRVPVQVSDAIIIPDALELLLQLHRSGEMHIVRYHEMSDKQREGERKMVLAYIKRRHALASPSPVDAFLRETFPDLWEEALGLHTAEPHATSLEPSIHSRSK